MKYKDYVGVTEIDEDAGLILGRVLGIRELVTFRGESVGEARRSFEEAVDDYLKSCRERGVAPEKPFSGKFVVRLEPELHRALARAAEETHQSMNAVVEQALRKQFGHRPARESSAFGNGAGESARGAKGKATRARSAGRPGTAPFPADRRSAPSAPALPPESARLRPGPKDE